MYVALPSMYNYEIEKAYSPQYHIQYHTDISIFVCATKNVRSV